VIQLYREPKVGLRTTPGEFDDDMSILSSRANTVALYATRRDSNDYGGVMSLENCNTLRKETVSIEWSRRKE